MICSIIPVMARRSYGDMHESPNDVEGLRIVEKTKNRKRSAYTPYVLQAVQELYRTHTGGEKYPKVTDVADKVAEIVSGLDGWGKYTGKMVQSSVSRVLPNLVDDGKVLVVNEKYYVPNCVEYARSEVLNEMGKRVFFKRRDTFSSSDNMLVVAVDTAKTDITDAKLTFERYLGCENCFGILTQDEFLVLMLRGNATETHKLCNLVKEAVEKCYDEQHKEPPLRLRRKTKKRLQPKEM